MDDKSKPGKPKDISDLKARLGLVKGAVPAGAEPAARPHEGGPGAGPVPPPVRPGSFPSATSVPAPPGMARPTAQTQPQPQDTRANPFAAMSSAVAQAAPAAHPYAVYSDDGKPVSQVGRGRWMTTLVVMSLAGVVGGILGYFWSVVSIDRANYNRMISDATSIKTEVSGLATRLGTIAEALKKSAQKSPNSAPDFGLIDALKAVDLKPPDQQKLFHTNYARLEDLTIDELFSYYNDSLALYEQIRRHVQASEKEKALLSAYVEQGKSQDVNYGVVIEPGKVTTSKLVQIVGPICRGGKGECTNVNDLEGFMVTYSPGGTPFAAKLNGAGVHVLPLEHTQMFDGMVAGAKPEALAAADYKRRLGNIRMLAGKLLQVQSSLLGHLDAAAKKPRL